MCNFTGKGEKAENINEQDREQLGKKTKIKIKKRFSY